MSSSDSTVRFTDDKRGVSAVIGFILIFGILILSLTTYQATIVPQQNAQTEFEHFEDNRNEMIELRNAISTAGQADVSQFPSVKLGTNYQTRLFTINPTPPTGTLQTSEPYNITISDGDTDVEVPTRFFEYQPGYNELRVGSTWYENSVLYLDERGTNSPVIIEEQNLVTDGDRLKLTVLQNEFSESGTSRTTIEMYPTQFNKEKIEELEGELTVKIPTRLTDSDHWEILNETLDENSAVRSNGVDEENPIGDGVFLLALEVDNEDVLNLNTVGIRSEPSERPVKNVQIMTGGSGNNGGNNGGSGGNLQLDYQKLENGDDGELSFSAINRAGELITVTGFSVDATSVENSPELNNDDDNEVEIVPQDNGQEGIANRDGPGVGNNRYKADGTSYNLDENAIINNGEEVIITMLYLRDQNGDRIQFELSRTSNEAKSDVTVTLEFDNGDTQEFYFEDAS